MGRQLYEAFFLGYTRKQWGLPPTEIPASVLKRLPLRFSYEDSYFSHPHQAIPRDGYTALVTAILDHPRIDVRLSTAYGAEDRTPSTTRSGRVRSTPGSATATAGSATAPWTSRRSGRPVTTWAAR